MYARRHLGRISGRHRPSTHVHVHVHVHVLQTTNVASTAIGPLLIGAAHDSLGAYSPILLCIAVLTVLLGLLGALFLRTPRRLVESSQVESSQVESSLVKASRVEAPMRTATELAQVPN